MKYFIDTEFIEGFHKPLFGKKRHFIDLISIGIVAEDGRTYYAVSNEFNPKDADDWVRKNVIDKIEAQLFQRQPTFAKSHFNFSLKQLLKQYGKTNSQIAKEITLFINPHINDKSGDYFYGILEDEKYLSAHKTKDFPPDDKCPYIIWRNQPEFYGYYADYDWVLFCSLFGRMIDLPKGFPMYCKDLKQMLDEKVDKSTLAYYGTDLEGSGAGKNLEGKLKLIKAHIDYPKQTNEHNALDDAKWNFELYKFIKSL